MIIGIDGNEANVDEQVGVSVYAKNLLWHFAQKTSSNLQFKVFLRDVPKSHLPKQSSNFHYVVIPSKILWSQLALPTKLFFDQKVDVFFTPAHYAPRFCPAPLVVPIHDLSYFYYPDEFLKRDLYKLSAWTKYSVKNAKKIIAVSENTKNDLIKFYNLPESKIEVIYNGYEKKANNENLKMKNSYMLNAKCYILYVGTLQPRKNVITLIKAFDKFRKQHPEFKLVIVGKKGWLYDEIFSLAKQLYLEKEIIFTDYVSDSELIQLYKNAFCFVLPSLYEGFGIPLLEAMAQGCPVLSSNSSSLPEIGGNACLYFDPTNVNNLVQSLDKLYDNNKLRNDLISKGKKRIQAFSWTKCANQTLEIFTTIHDKNN